MEKLKSVATFITDAWKILGITVVFLLLLESICFIHDRTARRTADVAADYVVTGLRSREWGPQLLEDINNKQASPFVVQYRPFVDFRVKPYRSKTVNIDAEGIRRTPQDPTATTKVAFAMGGSTMFGSGVPDEGTIPAYLARRLPGYRVVNYGSGWWTSSQSVVQLIVALHEGKRPNLVIFYDGINDTEVVTYGGGPGRISPFIEQQLARGLGARSVRGGLEVVSRPFALRPGAEPPVQDRALEEP